MGAPPLFRRGKDEFHAHTAPSDWYEGLVKAFVGDSLARDFYREIAAYLDADTRDLEQLVADIKQIEDAWPEKVLKRQSDWVGRSDGAYRATRGDGGGAYRRVTG